MKKLKLMLFAAFCIIAGSTFAQTATQATTTKKETSSTQVKVKKDGTPDKRYSENKNLKKDGTPDKRFKTARVDSVKTTKTVKTTKKKEK